jgi:hypothetical protein
LWAVKPVLSPESSTYGGADIVQGARQQQPKRIPRWRLESLWLPIYPDLTKIEIYFDNALIETRVRPKKLPQIKFLNAKRETGSAISGAATPPDTAFRFNWEITGDNLQHVHGHLEYQRTRYRWDKLSDALGHKQLFEEKSYRS